MNLRQVRKKIRAVGNIKKITNAMQLVSSIKMKKAQIEYKEGKIYRDFLTEMVKELSGGLKEDLSIFLKKNETGKDIYLLITSNKGLCGVFNYLIFKKISRDIVIKDSFFICYGKKGADFVHRLQGKILADFSKNSSVTVVSAIFDFILEKYYQGEIKNLYLVYNKFISSTKYQTQIDKILPVSLELNNQKQIKKTNLQYMIEPSSKALIDNLLKNFVEQKIRDAILSSQAGEHSARMIAMKNATDNAKEIEIGLTSLRNKLRQEKITYELLDMITAKESVENIN